MYDHTLHRGRKHFCCYWLQAIRIADAMKCRIKNCCKINGKQRIKMPAKGECVRLKNYEREIKSPIMIFADLKYSSV